jgi:hypothetical protein
MLRGDRFFIEENKFYFSGYLSEYASEYEVWNVVRSNPEFVIIYGAFNPQ